MNLVRTRILAALPIVALLLAVAPASAQMRTWTTTNGRTFEAEFVEFDSVLVMREPSGETYGMSIGDLAPADRKYLAERRIELAGGPATDELRFRPKIEWSRYDDRWKVKVRVEASSRAAAAATTVTDVRIERCETNRGDSLVRYEHAKKMLDFGLSLQRFGCEAQPTTGLEFKLYFDPPEHPIETIKVLRGSFTITTGELQEITVPRFAEQNNKMLKSPLLPPLGLKVALNPSGRQPGPVYDGEDAKKVRILRVGVTGNGRRVHTVELTDPKGNPLYEFGRFGINGPYDGEISTSTWWVSSFEPYPRDMQLRLVVLKNIREVVVPFEFTNLKVSERPKD
jgi:hypothetical protein